MKKLLSCSLPLLLLSSPVSARTRTPKPPVQLAAAPASTSEPAQAKAALPVDKLATDGVVVFEYRNDVKSAVGSAGSAVAGACAEHVTAGAAAYRKRGVGWARDGRGSRALRRGKPAVCRRSGRSFGVKECCFWR